MAKRGGEEISLFEWEHQKCEEHNLETYPRGCRDLLLVMPGRESSLTRGYRGILILTIRCQSTVWQSFLIMSLLSFSVLSSPPFTSLFLSFFHSLPLILSFLILSRSLSTPSTSTFSSPSLYHSSFSPCFPSLADLLWSFLSHQKCPCTSRIPCDFCEGIKETGKPTSGIFFSGLAGSSLLNILEGRTRKTHFDSGFMETSWILEAAPSSIT